MNKLLKLIYVNLLNLFDINKIIIARLEGVKSNLEKKAILTIIIAIFCVYAIYALLINLNINNMYYVLSIGFFMSTLLCFFTNVFTVESLIFKDADNDILFSLPLTRHQILFSKLFNIYLRNLFYVIIVMLSVILLFYNKVSNITDTQLLMYIISTLIIPFIPMVLSTIVVYVDDYFKTKNHNNWKYKLIKYFIIICLIGIIFLVFRDIEINNVNQIIEYVYNKISIIYPLTFIFYIAIKEESLLCFISLISISVIVVYLYTLIVSNNYLRICSMLKGIKKNNKFVYKKTKNCGKLFGMVKKEIFNLFNNKNYFINSFGLSIILSIILIIGLNIIDFSNVDETIICVYLPVMLGVVGGFCCSTISAMSLEKQNMQILRTMPIGMGKILFSKFITNIIIGTIIILVNGTACLIILDLNKWNILFNYIVPFVGLLFISLTGLILDYRFIEKKEENDNAIIRQRLVVMIPKFIALLLGVMIIIFPMVVDYKIIMGTYLLILIILLIVELFYLLFNRKKLLDNLFN